MPNVASFASATTFAIMIPAFTLILVLCFTGNSDALRGSRNVSLLENAVQVSGIMAQYETKKRYPIKEYTPQICWPQVDPDQEWSAQIITTIQKLRAYDPDAPVLFRIVADVKLKLAVGDKTEKYKLVRYKFALKDKAAIEEETAEFLTPLFTSIRYRMRSVDEVDVGIYELSIVDRDQRPPIVEYYCKKHTFKIPPDPNNPDPKEAYLDCKEWIRDFKESSPIYKVKTEL